jgi:hypothetical protein
MMRQAGMQAEWLGGVYTMYNVCARSKCVVVMWVDSELQCISLIIGCSLSFL